ncbi:ABC transporter substrate-binding protein [Millisia brevis]|uniref:ABC transporter substrate-binding protein n=1 Tax=Millisia brevis TaxID=264148 RepID=UPI00082C6653|nr:iron-siderophore ABC transporter substrate-binding protein [Millisia brevis]
MRTNVLKRLSIIAMASVVSAALVACGDGSGAGSSDVGNTDVATGGERFSTADEETAQLGSDAEPGVFPRSVVHALGTTEIPAKPERVVVLDTGEIDAVLALGITPIGIPSTEGANSVPSYLADEVAEATAVGTIQEPNLEAIAALQPDLILGSELRADKLYPQLSEIAPTVFSIRPGYPWKENFLLAGDALGEEEQAIEVLNSYQDSATALREKVQGDPTISLVRFMPNRLRLYGNLSLIGVILQDAGLSRPADQDVEDLAVEISPEEIDKADGDYIFYTSYGTPDATGETSVIDGAGWAALPAVAEGRAFRVDDDVWFLGLGPIGAQHIVADLDKFLTA